MSANRSEETRDLTPFFRTVALAAVVGSGLTYWWLRTLPPDQAATFGPLGDAMAPFAAILSATALFAAIEGVRLQREELKLQRRELSESREVMREQARAAERSAETQERLAKAQEALAERQADANAIALMGKSVDLTAEVLRIDSRIAEVSVSGDPRDNAVKEKLKEVRRKVIAVEDAFAEKAGQLVRGSEANHPQSGTAQPTPPGS